MLSSVNHLSLGSHQGQLEVALRNTFKGVDIKLNERKDIGVRNPITGNTFELDVWIPSLDLGFEFQDSYHFAATWYTSIPLLEIQTNDRMKKECISQVGIHLISVPCWWNFSTESLHATIHFERPDLLPNSLGVPIPANPPHSFFIEYSVPQVGELMLASFVESTQFFSESLSSANPWWIGEKYDGVRAIWNPSSKRLYSRRAIEIPLPASVIHSLGSCDLFLDGEAWQGRGLYNSMSSVGEGCEHLRMIVFDEPSTSKKFMPFETRYASLVANISDNDPFCILAFRKICEFSYDLANFLEAIIREGGEGIIARKPQSMYEPGRSASLLKIKSAKGDAEALVVKVARDNSLVLELPSGLQFRVQQEDDLGALTGDIVTFSYENLSRRDTPVNPRVVRVRKDLIWEDVVREFSNATTSEGFTTKPLKFWDDTKNVRKFFERFALRRNMDPLSVATWYATSRTSIEATKGGFGLCLAKGGYIKAIMAAFPEIGLEETKFQRIPVGYFNDVKIRREAFIKFAKLNNFDPLVAENWYFSRRKLFVETAGEIVKYYGTVKRALTHLFPELKLDPSNLEGNYWGKPRNRRAFFDDFARKHKFDPLIAANWYEITKSLVLQEKNGKAVLYFHDKSMANALVDLYPNIGLDKRKFSKKRKDFFDAFAKDNGFDPLTAAKWYPISKSHIMARKNAAEVMAMHRGSVVRALLHVYPNIGLNEDLFQMRLGKYWSNVSNQKTFFDEIAISHSLDPLLASSWYQLQEKLQFTKKLNYILSFYQGSLATALRAIYPNLRLGKLKPQDRRWSQAKNRRAFFENVAKARGLDPLVPENWYLIPRKDILQNKHSSYVLQYHNNSYATALIELFPDVPIDKNLLLNVPRRYWANVDNQRKFFISFAQEKGFDPFDPEMWYKVPRKQVLSKKGGQMVIGYHSKSYHKTLMSLFPDIGLDPNKFEFSPRVHHMT